MELTENLDALKERQKEYLRAKTELSEEITKSLLPILRKCKTSEEVIILKELVRDKIGCLDGLIEVNFAITWSEKE